MLCPKCKTLDTKVIDSRLSEDGRSIRRRRECEKCEARFTTFERMEFINFFVTKNNGNKEVYDRSKVERAILRASNKRNIEPEAIDKAIAGLEAGWWANKKWITSKRIWKDILRKLIDIDEVAALRFASVYNEFESSEDFTKFIGEEYGG